MVGWIHVGYGQKLTVNKTEADVPFNAHVYERGQAVYPPRTFFYKTQLHISGEVTLNQRTSLLCLEPLIGKYGQPAFLSFAKFGSSPLYCTQIEGKLHMNTFENIECCGIIKICCDSILIIIKICGGSIFMNFLDPPYTRMYFLNEL